MLGVVLKREFGPERGCSYHCHIFYVPDPCALIVPVIIDARTKPSWSKTQDLNTPEKLLSKQ